jgi:tRNA(fMet)-specific endonuclease VapC
MAYLLDTNIVSDLVRNPNGRAAARLAAIGEERVCTSVIVTAELHYGAIRRNSRRLSAQLEIVLSAIEVLPLDPPADILYGELRTRLEKSGQTIGPHDLFIAAHTLALGHTLVTDNEEGFRRVPGLDVENWLR